MAWISYGPDNRSDRGDLVNSVVIAVSLGFKIHIKIRVQKSL